MSTVQLTDDAKEDLRDLDGSARIRVFKALKKLESNPEQRGQPLGHSQQTGNLTNFCELIVGNRDYRVVYQVDEPGDLVVVWVIGKRADDEVYTIAASRLQLHDDAQVRAIGESLRPLLKGTPTSQA